MTNLHVFALPPTMLAFETQEQSKGGEVEIRVTTKGTSE